eukprot:gene13336-15683_t
MVKVNIKWNKEKIEVDVDPSQPVSVFKMQIFSVTMVPVERQKIMGFKGGILKDEAQWSELDLSEGKTLMMMGSAVELAKPEPVKFIEDLPPSVADALQNDLPAGLFNHGNTCYLNATLQCLKACPELVSILRKYKQGTNPTQFAGLVKASQSVFNDLSKSHMPVSTGFFLNTFRRIFPQFNEEKGGSYLQQDAEEAWSQLLTAFAYELPLESEKPSNPSEAVSKSMIGKLFGLAVIDQYTCKDNPSEESTIRQDTLLKLSCNIASDTSYLLEGLKRGLEEEISKNSPSLNREAIYSKKTSITQLPPYVMVQFVRFHWKKDVKETKDSVAGVKAKIIKAVQFPFVLDLYDLCTPDLKKQLADGRNAMDDIHNSTERKRKASEDSDAMVIEKKDAKKQDIILDVTEASLKPNMTGKYELVAVLTHLGRYADSGHYIGWVKKAENQWLKFDDDVVTPVSNEEIKKLCGGGEWSSAYICLYRSIPVPSPAAVEETSSSTTTTTTTTSTTPSS